MGVMGWGGSVYLSILGGTYCTQRSVESKRASEHLFFLAGKLFLCFFFLGSRGGTCSSSRRRKSVLVLFISFFLEGAFLVLLLLLGSTWLSLFLSLSFFPGRASLEEERGKRGEERKERKGSIRYISQQSSFGLGGRRREGHVEKSEEKVFGFFVFIYFYVIYIFIYILFSCI